ncbi:hypothetical protein Agub_g2647 [Astrephomene gubernaculifera]|uniref:PPM-type phosphatase domain-containing protein n=1 Tax=Astrephomene gubernaculifera TaxID=47775 RepID=A0AAD3DL35_9CHLO|nr:hypothetical protein Agub_g2647 [Astrephomene gubernaculifera]
MSLIPMKHFDVSDSRLVERATCPVHCSRAFWQAPLRSRTASSNFVKATAMATVGSSLPTALCGRPIFLQANFVPGPLATYQGSAQITGLLKEASQDYFLAANDITVDSGVCCVGPAGAANCDAFRLSSTNNGPSSDVASVAGCSRPCRSTGIVSSPAATGTPSIVVTGVFDGHGGHTSARYAQEAILSHIVNDKQLHRSLGSGDEQATCAALKAAFRKVDGDLLALAAAPDTSSHPSSSPASSSPASSQHTSSSPSSSCSSPHASSPSSSPPLSSASSSSASHHHPPTASSPPPSPSTSPHPAAPSCSTPTPPQHHHTRHAPTPHPHHSSRHHHASSCTSSSSISRSPSSSPLSSCCGAPSSPSPTSSPCSPCSAPHDGTTALVTVQLGGLLAVANAGDSRAVLCRGGQALRLSRDHTPACRSERERVEAAGGQVVVARGAPRVVVPLPGSRDVMQALSVTRSLGDPDFKATGLVICEPDVALVPLQPGADSFLIAASDGLWGRVGDQQAVDCVAGVLAEFASMSSSHRPSAAKEAARRLLRLALDCGSVDDVTVVVSVFAWEGGQGAAGAEGAAAGAAGAAAGAAAQAGVR